MKTNEELNALKEELETLNNKLAGLTEEELSQVFGGFIPPYPATGSFGGETVFKGTFDGSRKTVPLNIDPDQNTQE